MNKKFFVCTFLLNINKIQSNLMKTQIQKVVIGGVACSIVGIIGWKKYKKKNVNKIEDNFLTYKRKDRKQSNMQKFLNEKNNKN